MYLLPLTSSYSVKDSRAHPNPIAGSVSKNSGSAISSPASRTKNRKLRNRRRASDRRNRCRTGTEQKYFRNISKSHPGVFFSQVDIGASKIFKTLASTGFNVCRKILRRTKTSETDKRILKWSVNEN